MEKTCGNCRRSFSCTQAIGCWCGTITLNESQKAWIKQRFENCLCPDCLAAVAAGTLGERVT
jgi:uncharacterized protein YecT (DUF1311 family)